MERILFSREANPRTPLQLPDGGGRGGGSPGRGRGPRRASPSPCPTPGLRHGEKYNALNQKGPHRGEPGGGTVLLPGREHTYCPCPLFSDRQRLRPLRRLRPGERIFRQSHHGHSPAGAEVVLFTENARNHDPGSTNPVRARCSCLQGGRSAPDLRQPLEQPGPGRRAAGKAGFLRFAATVLVLEAWSDEATFYLWNGAKYTPAPGGQPLCVTRTLISQAPLGRTPAAWWKSSTPRGCTWCCGRFRSTSSRIQSEALNLQNELDRADAVRRGLCVRRAGGMPYTIPAGHWFAGSMLPGLHLP